MATTLPSYTRTIDSYFLSTWDEIQTEVTDNILNGTAVWAALKARGCLKKQVGGNNVDRTVRYALPTVVGVRKGDTMPSGETETTTGALWPFRNLAVPVQRDLTDDVANAGKDKIKDYAMQRMTDAKDALQQQFEVELEQALDDGTDATPNGRMTHFLGLNDLVPLHSSLSTGSYGGIARSNPWWQAKYFQRQANPEINYLPDMNHMYNTIAANIAPPNLIITDQTNFELYQDAALSQVQIIKGANTTLADLGFQTLYFNGKELIWTPNMTAGDTQMLNTDFIEFVYDPQLWFQMTEWKASQLSLTRVAQILCRGVLISRQPRRHGRLYDAANA